jgi:hypothetical protein
MPIKISTISKQIIIEQKKTVQNFLEMVDKQNGGKVRGQ